MTKEEQAKAYHEKIIKENPQAEAWDFQGAYLAGYDLAVEKACKWIVENSYWINQEHMQGVIDKFKQALKE